MSMSGVDNLEEKTPALVEAEERGRLALVAWCGKKRGRQRLLSIKTNIDQGALCKMRTGRYGIGLENALLIELATRGELRAEVLCPSRAYLMQAFRKRYG